MKPLSKTIEPLDASRKHSLIASVDIPPNWRNFYLYNIPIVGQFLAVLGNFPRYTINLEDCVDFMASDLESPESSFIGHRVGVYEAGKGKVE